MDEKIDPYYHVYSMSCAAAYPNPITDKEATALRLATVKYDRQEQAGFVTSEGIVLVETFNVATKGEIPTDLFSVIAGDHVRPLTRWYNDGGREHLEKMRPIPFAEVVYGPLYRNPRKIFGIGLNYADHASDLGVKTPQGIPGSFFKPATTIVEPGGTIKLPTMSHDVDGEGELAVVIGRECQDIANEDWLDYVAGFTVALDMTAIDILLQNTRYLTVAKSFESFFSFGPHLVTPDEVEDLAALRVATVQNDRVHAEDSVSNMTFPPDFLVAFHSKIMKWLPGDVLSTGTPLGAHLKHGDTLEGRVTGFEPLRCNVVDLKQQG